MDGSLPGSVARWIVPVVMLASFISLSSGQFTAGFSELDYTDLESRNGTDVIVTKDNTNVGDLFLNIRPLSVEQYDRMFGCNSLPVGLNCSLLDPAEFDAQGSQDFINDEIQVMFPPSDGLAEVTITIPFINDDINEARESFFITVTVDQVLNNPTDIANIQLLRNGVAQVNIANDDILTLSFEMSDYSVSENAGEANDLVFVIKDNGMESEQVLPILVSLSSGLVDPATQSMDFNITEPLPVQLEFAPTESRLGVPMTIFEDQILEPRESFVLQLSIPVDPPIGYMLGAPSTTIVHIDDNEQGRVGIEQEMYTVNEGDGSVEICFVIFEPSDTSLLDVNAFAEFGSQTNNGTALGEGADFNTVVDERVFLEQATPRVCNTITITDDDFIEDTEEFSVNIIEDDTGVPFPPFLNGDFIFDPVIATIVIIDNEINPNITNVTETTTTDDTDFRNVTTEPPTNMTTTEEPITTMGGDPHYSILLPTGQNLCYSVQGEHGFTFNLISNNKMQMNAMFVPDALREEVTWIGALGIVLKNVRYKTSNKTKIRFVASENKLYVGEQMSLNAETVEKLEFFNGKLRISEAERKKGSKRLDVEVDLQDIGLKFTVRFVKKCHLDMFWNKVADQPRNSHGMIGQFFRSGVEIDETRRLLLLPTMEPVPVMRKPVWHFMEREETEDKMCWVAMNPGYQGKKLLEGHYLDYLVNDVLSTKFKFNKNLV